MRALTAEEWASRHIYDPPPRLIHLKDLIDAAKDGISVQDLPSDHVVGMLYCAAKLGPIKQWEGALFHLPFTFRGRLKLRVGIYDKMHFGHPFLGPDGKVLELGGRLLNGGGHHFHQKSNLDLDTLPQHPRYKAWIETTFYLNKGEKYSTYVRINENNSKDTCASPFQQKPSPPYEPGPIFTYSQ